MAHDPQGLSLEDEVLSGCVVGMGMGMSRMLTPLVPGEWKGLPSLGPSTDVDSACRKYQPHFPSWQLYPGTAPLQRPFAQRAHSLPQLYKINLPPPTSSFICIQ